MPQDVVYALRHATVFIGPVPHRLRAGDPRWKSDPVVKAKPELFTSDPPTPDHPNPAARSVEQATAAPGEKRAVRR